ncbi:MAG TPA: PilZ domain-containing protein [Polyangiaceae bacterium]|jgi:hypothetical protein|nr:PilZ domain-containing protein [Polyangiaceae bacterium]
MTAARLDHFRAYARVPVRIALSVSPLGATYDQTATAVNLGLGGTCFEIAEAFEAGQRLRMELDLPGLWDRLTLHGEVAWTALAEDGLSRVGVRFTRPTGRTLRILAENLAAL